VRRRLDQADAEQCADGALHGLGVEEACGPVGDDERVCPRAARSADDGAEIARPLDSFCDEHERTRIRLEPREVCGPAADDGEQAVGARAAGHGAERGRAELCDPRPAPLGVRDEHVLRGAEMELGRRVDLEHVGARVECMLELPVALDEERVGGGSATQPPEGLQPWVRGAGDRESSCHGPCFRTAVRAGTKRQPLRPEEESRRAT
jgi:hypothetical protein